MQMNVNRCSRISVHCADLLTLVSSVFVNEYGNVMNMELFFKLERHEYSKRDLSERSGCVQDSET